MKKIFALSLVAAASLGLAACNNQPSHETNEVNAVETNLAAEAAIADVNATADNAVDVAGAALDNAVANDAGVANGVVAELTNNAM